jgi:hypothetical protein
VDPPLAAARLCVAQAAPPGRRTCRRGFDRLGASAPNLPGRSPPTEICWLQRRASLATAGRTPGPAAAAPSRRGLRCVSFSRQLVYSLYRDYGKNAETRGSARKKGSGQKAVPDPSEKHKSAKTPPGNWPGMLLSGHKPEAHVDEGRKPTRNLKAETRRAGARRRKSGFLSDDDRRLLAEAHVP